MRWRVGQLGECLHEHGMLAQAGCAWSSLNGRQRSTLPSRPFKLHMATRAPVVVAGSDVAVGAALHPPVGVGERVPDGQPLALVQVSALNL